MKCRTNTECKNPKVIMTTKKEWCFHQNVHRVIVKNHDLSKEKEEAGGLLTSLGLKTDISSKIPLLGHIYFYSIKWIKIINKFLLAGGKFIVVDNLLKTKKEYKTLKKQEIQGNLLKQTG